MKSTKRSLFCTLLAIVFIAATCTLAACDGGAEQGGGNQNSSTPTATELGTFSYDTELLSEHEDNLSYGYNNNLFYVNNLEFAIADPDVIYITEGEEAGWFYAYGTSDDIGCHGFQCWRSKDLSHWESKGVCMTPQSWAINNYWAPEVIYDGGMYYMFFGAFNYYQSNRLCISVAVSDNPYGPFEEPSGVRNYHGKLIGNNNAPIYDFTQANTELQGAVSAFRAKYPGSDFGFIKNNCLDASPFIDPATGDKYLYFSYYDSYSGGGSFIYGVKMLDWYTPDYATLSIITYVNYDTVEHGVLRNAVGPEVQLREANVNEGPHMIYAEGKYYMTFSVFGFEDENYQVKQAIADSPLGDFKKVSSEDGGKVVSTDVANWSHLVSAGHHCFITVGNELFIAYHTFKDRNSIAGGRALAVDKVVWTTNSQGTKVMHTNGPTWSVQALPESISGYKNIAPAATVTATNTAEGSSVSLLTDGLIKYQEFDLAEEYEAKKGQSVITLDWGTYKTVRAIMVYNSYDYDYTFVSISKVQIDFMKADGSAGSVTINNLPYDWDWHYEPDAEFVRPGGAAIAEFYDMPVKRITLTINTPDGADALALNEIVVLGKNTAMSGVSSFKEYEYEPVQYGSPKIINESRTFGSVEGTKLVTEYGYDLSHDDGTENAYVEQKGVADQSCYFNDVYSTSFYVEASFTVTRDKAFAYNNYTSDPYPKFGLAVSCADDRTNTIFFYVDAVGFTNKAVGVAQRMLDNSDWDWNSTEQIVSVNDMAYTNGNFVKLAILRRGAEFYFFCNGQPVIHYSTFNVFTERQAAGVGFRCFSTAMLIKDYYATDDTAEVDRLMDLYTSALVGDYLGDVGGRITTSGWDLSADEGASPVAVQTSGGDQYAYFKSVNATSFYAETKIRVSKDLGDPWPKFGLAAVAGDNTLFFYIDGSQSYRSTKVGYVWRDAANEGWVWADSVETSVSGLKYYEEGEYATLGMLREGNVFYLFVNGELIFTVSDVRAFGEDDACVVSILSFTTGITVKDYFATIDSKKFPEVQAE